MDIVKTVLGAIQYAINMIKEDKQLSIDLKIGLRSIKDDLETMKKKEEEYDELQLQELAYDIEDFTEGLWVPGALGPVLSAIGMSPKDEHVKLMNDFKDRIDKMEKRQQRRPEFGTSSSTAGETGGSSYSAEDEDVETLVGIDKPMEEVIDLLSSMEEQLRVISIVGCHGVGKTALARQAYKHCRASRNFNSCIVAWVVASDCSHASQFLTKVREAVRIEAGNAIVSTTLRDILERKRYLVFIDDVRAPVGVWKAIVNAFPENDNSSRIIMTTSVRSVAAACSSGRYMYTMSYLGDADSKNLLWTKVYGRPVEPVPALVSGSKSIFSKCQGSPLALISVATELSTKGGRMVEHLSSDHCEEAGKTVSAFGEMRRALVQCYDGLPDCDHKNCLLYLSIFPRGHEIKYKSLLRRLVAEGLVAQDSNNCLVELIDRCIVEPVQICCNSSQVKRCQVNGVMLEYVIEQAVNKNMVTLIDEHDNLLTDGRRGAHHIRRLSIQSCAHKEQRVEDISVVRSLTLFNCQLHKLTSCKMLRLLDLEGCRDLNKSIDHICELWLLRYLSLRKTDVSRLPRNMENLKRLVTLDIRETESPGPLSLPIEVIMLPKLEKLFGKFKLLTVMPGGKTDLVKFLSHRSQLHTLAGLDINEKQGIILLGAQKLKKVKVWYDPGTQTPCSASVSAPDSSSVLSPPCPAPRTHPNKGYSIMNPFSCFFKGKKSLPQIDRDPPTVDANTYPQSELITPTSTSSSATTTDLIKSLEVRSYGLESVSIHSNELCLEFLISVLKSHSTISSLKLQGRLRSLPNIEILKHPQPHNNLKRLHLLSTGLSSEDLSELQSLRSLEYLKLVENPEGFDGSNFIVRRDGFQSLKQLCFQAPKLPNLQFEDGAMQSLVSLHLLCSDSSQMQTVVEGISNAANLNEVVIHHSVTEDAQDHWKRAIRMHPNSPCVKKQPELKANTYSCTTCGAAEARVYTTV